MISRTVVAQRVLQASFRHGSLVSRPALQSGRPLNVFCHSRILSPWNPCQTVLGRVNVVRHNSSATKTPGTGVNSLDSSPKSRQGQSGGTGSGPNGANGANGSAKGQAKRPGLKELMKKYGWTALGVYLTLSAIDLPLCYLFVHQMGEEKVRQLQNKVLSVFGYGQDPDQVSAESKETGSDWKSIFLTELTIAYAIHKTVFVFVRVPLTAALTPVVAKRLQRWGFKVGQAALNNAPGAGGAVTGSNAAAGVSKFGTSPTNRQKWFSGFF